MNYKTSAIIKTPKSLLRFSLFLLLIAGVSSASANSLTDMNFSTMAGNRLQVVLTLEEPLTTPPTSFSTDSPARIAVDLEGVSSSLKNRTLNIGQGAARSVTAVEAGGKTRIVLNLTNPVGYELDMKDNLVVLAVDGGAVQAAESASKGGHQAASGSNQLTGVDFKRGEKGKAELVFSLSTYQLL